MAALPVVDMRYSHVIPGYLSLCGHCRLYPLVRFRSRILIAIRKKAKNSFGQLDYGRLPNSHDPWQNCNGKGSLPFAKSSVGVRKSSMRSPLWFQMKSP